MKINLEVSPLLNTNYFHLFYQNMLSAIIFLYRIDNLSSLLQQFIAAGERFLPHKC